MPVEEKRISAFAVEAEDRAAGLGWERAAGLGEPDVAGERAKADRGVDRAVRREDRLPEREEAEAAAAGPARVLRDPTLLALDHLGQAEGAMGPCMRAHLDADPAPAHLVRHCGRRAGAEEAVEDEVAGIRGDVEDPLNKALRLRALESLHLSKKRMNLLLDSSPTSDEGHHVQDVTPGTSERYRMTLG
jgi:hypothetical protein